MLFCSSIVCTSSTVITDRLLRDTPNLPFIATIKQKGRYLY